MRKKRIVFLWIGIIALVASGHGEQSQEAQKLAAVVGSGVLDNLEILARSAISSVTIFPDRATVVREAEVILTPETKSIVFSGLPASLIPSSLRVSGKGTASVRILGVDMSTEYLETALLPEIQKLQAEIAAQEFEIARTKSALEVVESQEKFLKSIEASTTSKASQEVTMGKPDVQSWEKVLDFLGTKLQGLNRSRLDIEKTLKEQQAKLDALNKKLQEIIPQRTKEGKKVAVLLDVAQGGKFQLSLTYTVNNARWFPIYTMRALPDTGEIEFITSATIVQKSGENWNGVKALLATTSPSLESQPEELRPWILDIYVPRPTPERREKVAGGVVGGVVGGVIAAKAPVEAEAMRGAEMESAAILETGLHLNFEIKRAISVPSDGSPHKVPIDSQKIKAKFDYVAVPKLKEMSFLRGTLLNTLPYPILPGAADLFIIQDFVGSTRLSQIAMEEEAKMYFGEDRQIKVTREQVKREKATGGLLSKSEKLRFVFKIMIQNFRKTAVDIDIFDQIPISQNTKIEVKDVNLTPLPSKKDEKGILSWTFHLAPQEKREILIDFTIEYPKDTPIIL